MTPSDVNRSIAVELYLTPQRGFRFVVCGSGGFAYHFFPGDDERLVPGQGIGSLAEPVCIKSFCITVILGLEA